MTSDSASPLNLVHTVGSLRKSAGGPTRTVTTLCRELARCGAHVELVSQDSAPHPTDDNLLPPADLVTTTLARAYRLPLTGNVWSPTFSSLLLERCRTSHVTVIHDHGVWLPANRTASVAARKLGLPLVVSTRGMLEPWALNHRSVKKWVAWRLYQRESLSVATVLHATAEQEAENLRHLGLRQHIAVIPNGVELQTSPRLPRAVAGPRIALFLSRIHPKKGLMELVEAWRMVRPHGWRLIIAGPDEDGHRTEVERAVQQAGLTSEVEFSGPVDGTAKSDLYRRADLFVLPTFSENFGVVVAEALSRIASRSSPPVVLPGMIW